MPSTILLDVVSPVEADELTFGAVVAATGLSPSTLRRRDAELQPTRSASGERLYRATRVAAFAIERAARKAAR